MQKRVVVMLAGMTLSGTERLASQLSERTRGTVITANVEKLVRQFTVANNRAHDALGTSPIGLIDCFMPYTAFYQTQKTRRAIEALSGGRVAIVEGNYMPFFRDLLESDYVFLMNDMHGVDCGGFADGCDEGSEPALCEGEVCGRNARF